MEYHLLEYVLLFDTGTDQIRFDLLNELFEFVAGHVIIDQGGIAISLMVRS